MSAPTLPVPASLEGLQRHALVVGGVGVLALGLGAALDTHQFLRSYLVGFLFWLGIGIGCQALLMIQHLTGGLWGLAVRGILEAGARTLLVAPVLFLPVALGVRDLYAWARPDLVAADEVLRQKQAYLNVPFFLARAAFYFAVWAAFAHLLNRWSAEQATGDPVAASRKLRILSGGGLVAMALTITFASVDWAMSLDPHWFSTIYGVLFMAGWVLSALAFVIVLLARLGRERPLSDVVTPGTTHDLGKLLLAFVMFWAYIAVSQLIIVWSGNLPEEIPWYLERLGGGWGLVAVAIALFHFGLPFLLLLSRDLKRNATTLAVVASGVLLMRLVDLFWLVAPDLQGGHGGHGAHAIALHWMDVVAPVALGGVWLRVFTARLRSRPLLPVGEPEIRRRLVEVRA